MRWIDRDKENSAKQIETKGEKKRVQRSKLGHKKAYYSKFINTEQ